MADDERAQMIRQRKLRLVAQISRLQGDLRRAEDDERALANRPLLDALTAERERVRPIGSGRARNSGRAENEPQLDRLLAERDNRDHYRTG